MKKIYLKRGKEESLLRFHPWVFSGAIQQADDDLKDGDLVRVLTNHGDFIAVGHFQMGSIAVRVLSFRDVDSREGEARSKESFIAMIEQQTECKCSSVEIHTSPDIDLKKRSESGDFIASVIQYGLNLESATREELVNIVCETPAINKTLRQNFEEMTSDELRDVVDDAIKLIVAKMGAAR